MVENIDKTSRQLKTGAGGRQDDHRHHAPEVPGHRQDQIGELPGKRFAVIIDEAHSSQSGESTKSLKSVLAVGSLEEAEKEESETEEDGPGGSHRRRDEDARARCPTSATSPSPPRPSPRRWSCSARKRPDGKFAAFSLYTMRQAIEESFILDVLENYTTYKTYWNLLKKIAGRPAATTARRRPLCCESFVDLHEHTIDKKVADHGGALRRADVATRSAARPRR